MKSISLLFLVLLVPFLVWGQAPTIEWQNTIGGAGTDNLSSLQQTSDGGYILGGWSISNISGDKSENSKGASDYWAVKLDSLGSIQWQNTIGGSSGDLLYAIQQTSDGGYILGGGSGSNTSGDKTEDRIGFADYWVVKLDSLGMIQWENTIGGQQPDNLTSIVQTSDGGYILGGDSQSAISGDKTENSSGVDYWVVKLDSLGSIQWQNTIGGSGPDNLSSLQQTSDGGYILGGDSQSAISGDKTENSSGVDYWIVKLDSLGSIQWQNTIGGSSTDEFYSLQQTSDGGYILSGYSQSNISGDKTENQIGGWDYWVVKLDSLGSIQWQNTIGGGGNDYLFSIQQTIEGGYILGGHSLSSAGGDKTENPKGAHDFWVVKLDTLGIVQWDLTIGGSQDEELNSLIQTSDGGYLLGGISSSNISGDKTENRIGLPGVNGPDDFWIVKLTPDPTISSKVEGVVFEDINKNGIFDLGEIAIDSVKVNLSNGQSTYTDNLGNYSLYTIDTGSFTLSIIPPLQYLCDSILFAEYTTPPTGAQTIQIDTMKSMINNKDFGISIIDTLIFKPIDSFNGQVDTVIIETFCDTTSYYLNGELYDTTGIYFQKGVSYNNCDSIVSLNLTLNFSPTADAGPDQYFCDTTTSCAINLAGSVMNATGGVWSSSGTGTFVPNPFALVGGAYCLSALDLLIDSTEIILTTTGIGVCIADTDTMHIIISSCTGLDNEVLSKSFTVLPNPFIQGFDIVVSSTLQNPIVRLYNLTGQLIFVSSGLHIDATNLNAGLYVVEVTDNGDVVGRLKVIKQ